MFKVQELIKATRGKLISGNVNLGIKGISIDSRTIRRQELFIAIKGNKYDGHSFIEEAISKGASCIIREAQNVARCPLSAAREVVLIETRDTIRALGDIARFKRQKFDIPIIAVTGSNGKTTAKEMIAGVLSRKFKVLKNEGTQNNQIGLPLTLINLKKSHDIAVLEIGTNHFGEVRYLAEIAQPNIGMITNIGPAHLGYFRSLRGVFREKYSLASCLKNPKIAILNADDSLLREQTAKFKKKPAIFSFGIKQRADFLASDIKILNRKISFSLKSHKFRLNTLGYHNIYNALAVIAAARILGMGYNEIASGLSSFEFPQSRLCLRELNNTKIIDDTYNSNPSSLRHALDSLNNFSNRGRKIMVMGDMLELGRKEGVFHRQAGSQVAEICDAFITVGKLSRLAAQAAKVSGLDMKNIYTCRTTEEARDILFNKISPDPEDIVLVKGSRAMRMEEVFKR